MQNQQIRHIKLEKRPIIPILVIVKIEDSADISLSHKKYFFCCSVELLLGRYKYLILLTNKIIHCKKWSLVTFTEEMLNGKLHFLWSDMTRKYKSYNLKNHTEH